MSKDDPYLIEGPAVVSFSGGRTSGFMLAKIMERGLQPDVHILFANTGKERPETLDFVRDCAGHFSAPVIWLEYFRKHLPKYRSEDRRLAAERARAAAGKTYLPAPDGKSDERGFREVTWETAARAGEPFENLIEMMGLPNVTTRMCTQEMKIRIIKKKMLELGYDEWINVVGIRADEPKRVARMRNPTGQRWENELPLDDARVALKDVLAFWATQSFDLMLPKDENGETYGGNCDLCFLKSTAKKARVARENPELVQWWVDQENRTGMRFRTHATAYEKLQLPVVRDEAIACNSNEDDAGDCVCHD